jgi:hypothetical protein
MRHLRYLRLLAVVHADIIYNYESKVKLGYSDHNLSDVANNPVRQLYVENK